MKTNVPKWLLPAGAVGKLLDAAAAYRPRFSRHATVGQAVFSQRALAIAGDGFRYRAAHANRPTPPRAKQTNGWVTGARL